MKKVLVGIIVAAVLFAVGAFAASFAVNSEDIASGKDNVNACAAEVDVDFVTVYDNAGDWNVTGAELTFYNSAGAAVDTCEGFGANVAVMTTTIEAGGAPAATGTATVPTDSTTVTVDLSPTTTKASAVRSAAVLVDGQELQVATPGQGFPTTTVP